MIDILGFFEAVIIITVGILCVLAWVAGIIVVLIELYDFITERGKTPETDEEEWRL